MAKLTSAIDSASPEFRANQEAMAALVGDLLEKRAAIAKGGPAKARERHQARGKLTARDRVNQLLDPGSPFLEIAPMAAFGMYEDANPCRRADRRDRADHRAAMHDPRQ